MGIHFPHSSVAFGGIYIQYPGTPLDHIWPRFGSIHLLLSVHSDASWEWVLALFESTSRESLLVRKRVSHRQCSATEHDELRVVEPAWRVYDPSRSILQQVN